MVIWRTSPHPNLHLAVMKSGQLTHSPPSDTKTGLHQQNYYYGGQ